MSASFILMALLSNLFAIPSQARPDFSGMWIGNAEKNIGAISTGTLNAVDRISVVQSERSVIVTPRPVGPDGQDLPVPANSETVCNFGAKPAENLRPMLVESCLATWNGDSLVTTLETKGAGGVPFRVTVITYSMTDGRLKTTRTDGECDAAQH